MSLVAILRQRFEMPDRPARRQRCGRGDDRIGIDTVVPIELRNRACLSEMLDPEGAHAMAVHGAEPGERRRMAVDDGHDPAVGWHIGQQLFDMRAGVHEATLARALRRGPAGVETVRRSDGKQAHVTAVFGHQPHRLDRFRHDRPCIADDDLAIRTGRTLPIGAVDDGLP